MLGTSHFQREVLCEVMAAGDVVASCITIVCHCKTGPSLVGARAAQQYLAAGIVDEMEINLVPTLLGSGERLFDGVGDDLHGLALVRTIATPKVTHLARR